MENNDLKSNEKLTLFLACIAIPVIFSVFIFLYAVVKEDSFDKRLKYDLKVKALEKGCVVVGD